MSWCQDVIRSVSAEVTFLLAHCLMKITAASSRSLKYALGNLSRGHALEKKTLSEWIRFKLTLHRALILWKIQAKRLEIFYTVAVFPNTTYFLFIHIAEVRITRRVENPLNTNLSEPIVC